MKNIIGSLTFLVAVGLWFLGLSYGQDEKAKRDVSGVPTQLGVSDTGEIRMIRTNSAGALKVEGNFISQPSGVSTVTFSGVAQPVTLNPSTVSVVNNVRVTNSFSTTSIVGFVDVTGSLITFTNSTISVTGSNVNVANVATVTVANQFAVQEVSGTVSAKQSGDWTVSNIPQITTMSIVGNSNVWVTSGTISSATVYQGNEWNIKTISSATIYPGTNIPVTQSGLWNINRDIGSSAYSVIVGSLTSGLLQPVMVSNNGSLRIINESGASILTALSQSGTNNDVDASQVGVWSMSINGSSNTVRFNGSTVTIADTLSISSFTNVSGTIKPSQGFVYAITCVGTNSAAKGICNIRNGTTVMYRLTTPAVDGQSSSVSFPIGVFYSTDINVDLSNAEVSVNYK